MRAVSVMGAILVLLTLSLLQKIPTEISAYNNGMGKRPIMGWNSWCTDSLCNLFSEDPCNENMVLTTADAIVKQGLDKLGYQYIDLDDCWSAKARDTDGHLQADPEKFPRGMKYVSDYVHSKGLYFGLYTSVGTKTCKGDRPGSYGYFAQDAATLASWGIDKVKMDHCTAPDGISDQELYTNFSNALK